jgi:hypothetical protein
MRKSSELLGAALGLFVAAFASQASYACEVHHGSLVISTDKELAEAQKVCAVTGSIDFLVFGAPRDVRFEKLAFVGQALNFTGNSLLSLNLPKLERVGWWIHIASKSYHQQYLESVSLPLLREGTVQVAVTPKLRYFTYDPCASAVIDDDSTFNLKNLGLLRGCDR